MEETTIRALLVEADPVDARFLCETSPERAAAQFGGTSSLPKPRRKLQAAYEQPAYPEATPALAQLHRELRQINLSAPQRLAEGLEETLTLHRIALFALLGQRTRPTKGWSHWPRNGGLTC